MVSWHSEHPVLGAGVTESVERKSDESVTKWWVGIVQISQMGAHITGSVVFWACPTFYMSSTATNNTSKNEHLAVTYDLSVFTLMVKRKVGHREDDITQLGFILS